jgi:hypothetical protein
MGIVWVAFLAAIADCPMYVTMTSTLSRTKSAAAA